MPPEVPITSKRAQKLTGRKSRLRYALVQIACPPNVVVRAGSELPQPHRLGVSDSFPLLRFYNFQAIETTSKTRCCCSIAIIVTPNTFQTMTETSIWTGLREPGFRSMRFAGAISGICVAAHGTTAIWILNMLS
jgi:hypothetical protein